MDELYVQVLSCLHIELHCSECICMTWQSKQCYIYKQRSMGPYYKYKMHLMNRSHSQWKPILFFIYAGYVPFDHLIIQNISHTWLCICHTDLSLSYIDGHYLLSASHTDCILLRAKYSNIWTWRVQCALLLWLHFTKNTFLKWPFSLLNCLKQPKVCSAYFSSDSIFHVNSFFCCVHKMKKRHNLNAIACR